MNFIFDFDGTIADSLPAFIAVFNKTVRGENDPLTDKEILNFRGMPTRKAIKMAGVRWWQIPKLIIKGIPDFHAMVPSLRPCKDMPEVLSELHQRGDKLFIVTSNTRESADIFLKQHKLNEYFTDVVTSAGLFNKSRHIRRLIRQHELKRRNTVYVGDETRDVQAARLAFIKPVSVTWGFNTKEILKKQRPTYIIDKPKQLLELGGSK